MARQARLGGRELDVIVILVDTLRGDRLSLDGYERATSPNLDRFLRQGAVFRAAARPLELKGAEATLGFCPFLAPKRRTARRSQAIPSR